EKLTPTHTGWFAQDDIAAMAIHANRPARSARRFEAGTPPVINRYAAEAGLQLITEVGVQAIQQRIAGLTGQCLQGLAELNWPSATPAKDQQRGPMVCIEATDAAELVGLLDAQNIVLSCRGRNLRAMFHFYNNEADVAHLLQVLAARRSRYRPG
ncbi:MAG: aminotransferase class V-fold PLP-dependent enzyme, partial [Sinobacteraceae bacterium]|nr:aminotransferase class V-fold PLP-dependent enzyme [Nevskiaceae bacterium]